MSNYHNIAVTIGSAANKVFRFRSETKDGAAVYFDTTADTSYMDATKFVLRMTVPENDRGRFTHTGEARVPFVRTVNGVTSVETANITISVRASTSLSAAELVEVSDTLKALAGEQLLARGVRERTVPGWPAV